MEVGVGDQWAKFENIAGPAVRLADSSILYILIAG